MTIDPTAQPLLSESPQISKSSPFLSLRKWTLKILMWVIFLSWLGIIFTLPGDSAGKVFALLNAMNGTVFGLTGSVFLVMSGPILIIALLAYIYVANFSEARHWRKPRRFPTPRLWTFPVLLDGPFGVVSAAEFIWIILFSAYLLWAVAAYLKRTANYAKDFTPNETYLSPAYFALEYMGAQIGVIGLICTSFLFLPVARGSILLRLIDIPFEHATRYHVWLGHLTMILFSLHGILYLISWTIQGQLLDKVLEWKSFGVANLPGVISLLAGLLMWLTSLQQVRERYFELFFYTHQLYVVFIMFFVMHVGDFVFSYVAGGVFLFVLDRFLRFCQSRATVSVVSASCLPCGTVELVLSKPSSLKYNALSFIFLQVRELSWLQWHPFSVSSSPLDGKNHIAILIKVLGGWTEKLRTVLTSLPDESPMESSSSPQPKSITASVEGPYGHEVAYHLMYDNLVLVAGGIGISPFLAVLSDILHRVEEKRSCLPKNILIVWAVKSSKELSLLSLIDLQNICPSFSSKLNLKIQAYVTQESQPPLEEGDVFSEDAKIGRSSFLAMSKGGKMSNLVGTGNNFWAGAYYAASIAGFVISYGCLQKFYTIPFGVTTWWYKGLLFLACMVGSVVLFGGLIVFLWRRLERENSDPGNDSDSSERNNTTAAAESGKPGVLSLMNTDYGRRPDFQDIFDDFARTLGHEDVGVLVCGPSGLQTNVARECRRQILGRKRDGPIFHFHSHSFDL